MQRTCLACGKVNEQANGSSSEACQDCGAIYAKVESARAAKRSTQKLPPIPPAWLDQPAQADVQGAPGRTGDVKSLRPSDVSPLAALVLASIIVAFFWWNLHRMANSDGGSFAPTPYTDGRAIAACKEFVEQRLKAPGSARYPAAPDVNGFGVGAWNVRGNVDSQNSFGAMLRMQFNCHLRLDEHGDHLVDLEME